MKDDLFERLERAIGGLMIHGIDSSAITEAVTEIVTLTKQLEKTCGALVLQEKMRREMEQAAINDFDKILELTKQRDALFVACKTAHFLLTTTWPPGFHPPTWTIADLEAAVALCPEVKERKDGE